MARGAALATHAAHGIQAPVQVDHVLVAGLLVQAVHVLREQQLELAEPFQPGQGMVGGIGQRLAEPPPADQAARPVALAGEFLTHEGLVGHRLGTLPAAIGVAIIRNARIGAAAGAGQHEQAPVLRDETLQGAAFRFGGDRFGKRHGDLFVMAA